MAFCPTRGCGAAKRMCDALGIKGPVHRLVIDFQMRNIVMVYVQRALDNAELEPLEQILRDAETPVRTKEVAHVAIDEKGNVCHEPA
jgi:hypothetical protein